MSEKVLVIGSSAVGKTSIIQRFVEGRISNEYNPTLEDDYRKIINVDGQEHHLNLIDTWGEEEFHSLTEMYYRCANYIVIVFAINDESSFNHVEQLRNEILRILDTTTAPLIVCGNKSDLESQRTVQTERGVSLCNRFRVPYIETSALTGANVDAIFETVIRRFSHIIPEHSAEIDTGPKDFCSVL